MRPAVPHLPSRLRRRRLEDRRNRQDRRAVLFLQDAAEDAQHAAAVDADDRHRRRADQHRPGRFRRRRARPPRPQEGARRQVLPPDGPRAAPDRRGAEHLRQRRSRAADDHARERQDVRLHPRADPVRAGLARAGQARGQGRADRPRDSARRVPVRQLADPLRQPRDGEGAEGVGHRGAAARVVRAEAVGLLGAQPRPGPVRRSLALGSRQGQGRRRDGRVVGHRQGDRAQDGRGRAPR